MGIGRRFWVVGSIIGMLAALMVAPAGADQEAALDGHRGACTIVGTSGDDTLVGTNGDDVICGRGGNDRIFGNGGNDVLRGGDGDDVIRGGSGNDILRGNDGNDKLFGGAHDDDLSGGPGDDILRGKRGDDNLEGNKGNDRLYGARGNDTLNGGQGIDACDEGRGSDTSTGCEIDGQVTDLQLLGINDYHGHVLDEAAGVVDGEDAGGGEYLAAMLNHLRDDGNSLTVAAGDLIGGSPAFSGLFHDEPSVESLNAMHLDVSSVGNHEFDEGVTELLRMQDGGCHPVDGCYFDGEEYPGADFNWLAANVQDAGGDTVLPGYWVTEVDGVSVGFIGMTLEATNVLVSAEGIEGWDFLDEVETANALVPMLQAEGVEAIVVLLHEGGSQTPPPGDVDACVGISGPIVAINDGLDPAIDVLITGHTHLPYNCTLPDPDGHPRIVTSAYSFGRVVTEVDLVLEKSSGDVNRYLSSSTNHAVIRSELIPDATQTAIIERWRPLFEAAGNTPVGTITADINRGGDPPGADRGVESPAGNLVADAQLWATSAAGAQIAFMNPGGVRSDLIYASSAEGEGDGVVTFGEAFTFQPFGNTLLTFPMTGAEIQSVLEEQCQPAGSSRPFLHLGVSEGFTYDLATTFDGATGDCVSATITNMMLNGAPIDMAASYQITVNSFLSTGGDNFTTFADVNAAAGLDGGVDLSALTNYLGTFGPVAPPSTDRVNELP